MTNATSDLRLLSQPRVITALWLVPNYTAWWQRHMCVNNLPKVVTWQCPGAESNLLPWVTSGLQVRHVTVRLPSHTRWCIMLSGYITVLLTAAAAAAAAECDVPWVTRERSLTVHTPSPAADRLLGCQWRMSWTKWFVNVVQRFQILGCCCSWW